MSNHPLIQFATQPQLKTARGEVVCDTVILAGNALLIVWLGKSLPRELAPLEDRENIRVNVISFNQAMQLVGNGRINNAPCILALQWLALNRARLQQKWGH